MILFFVASEAGVPLTLLPPAENFASKPK